jgi:hypothetical protein
MVFRRIPWPPQNARNKVLLPLFVPKNWDQLQQTGRLKASTTTGDTMTIASPLVLRLIHLPKCEFTSAGLLF